MIKPETPLSAWTRMQGYPKISRQSGVLSATDKFECPDDDFDITHLEEIENIEFEGLKIVNSSVEVNENSARVFITVSYANPTAESLSYAKDGVTEYSLDDSGQEISIDRKKRDGSFWFPNYKTNWNYILAAKKGITSSPSYWTTATDTVIPDEDAEKFKWCKDSSDVPVGWRVALDKTKRAESVILPSAMVVEKTRYSTYNSAVAKKSTVGSKKTPGKTFGYPGEWLVMSSSIYQDGRKWVCQTQYQNAPEWDSDFIN